MNDLDAWLETISAWYKDQKHDQVLALQPLILNPPENVWGPTITDQQSKGIACWLDGCLRLHTFYLHHDCEKAYQYLMLAYSKLQSVCCDPMAEQGLKEWCVKRIQHLCVLALEFSNQQRDTTWQKESESLIESHVKFMASISWNDDQVMPSVRSH